jgi:hypothetical protein
MSIRKVGGKYFNIGKTGKKHGAFSSKKATAAQTRAMFSHRKPGAKWGKKSARGR